MSTLVLIRHGQSEWNLQNRFTGWRDPDLTEQGIAEAHAAGVRLRELGLSFDSAFTSELQRAQRTLDIVLAELDQELPIKHNKALNERDYGDLSGQNKAEAAEQFGKEQVHMWRRSYDVPPPGGESLKMTAQRVLPYFKKEILPQLRAGKHVLIAAHGNSLRALVMQLEQLSPDEIVKYEIATGVPIIYQLDEKAAVQQVQILN